MKIVLNRDVKNLGKVGDVCEVANGYGRNFLLPKHYAVVANKKNLSELQEKLEKLKEQNAIFEKEANEVANMLNGEVFNLVRQASDDDTIYGSIRTKDIYELIKSFLKTNNKDFKFDIGGIEMQTIKSLGKYVISVYLFANVCAKIRLNVCRIVSDFESDIVAFDKKFADALVKVDDTKKNAKLLTVDKKVAKIAEKEQKKADAEAKRKSSREAFLSAKNLSVDVNEEKQKIDNIDGDAEIKVENAEVLADNASEK